MSTIDAELLMRYADNEISLPERRLVEDQLKIDADARDLLATFRDQRNDLRSFLTIGEDDAGLRSCEDAIERALERRRRLKRRTEISRWALPIAASLLITLAGGLLSAHYAEQRAQSEIARILAEQATENAQARQLALQTRVDALERMLSGDTLTWTNEDSGSEGSITPLRTFQRPDGRWCREYRERTSSHTAEEERLSIACRDSEGRWNSPI